MSEEAKETPPNEETDLEYAIRDFEERLRAMGFIPKLKNFTFSPRKLELSWELKINYEGIQFPRKVESPDTRPNS